ncbi:MAG TPA: aldolase/citrate lyase family protein [Thauera aminoaromatica]|nr:aldolase/citrate lyase family protein [Thauera aminoaromatica]
MSLHPAQVLFAGEKPFPALPAVDHYAGAEKLMMKALKLQQELGPVFDLTCDCEDGAQAGAEAEHAQMVVEVVNGAENHFGRVGARIHDVTHPHWQRDLDILVGGAGRRLAFVTIPKVRSAADAAEQIRGLRRVEAACGLERALPVHVLIETHGALREAWEIAALDGVESIDFGLMDFVSGHHGAIPGNAMKSPGQFEHPLVVRAKADIAAAALANGVVPSHNVTTELQDVAVIRNDAERARREFGFLRMWSIHPNQILPIIAAMQPDFSEVEEAAAILCAAQDNAWGPIRHQGRLHDRASYRYYWELLQRARNTGMELPGETRPRFFTGAGH